MPGKGINGRANMQKFQMNSKKYGGNPFKYTSLVSSVGRASKGGMWNSIQRRAEPTVAAAAAAWVPQFVDKDLNELVATNTAVDQGGFTANFYDQSTYSNSGGRLEITLPQTYYISSATATMTSPWAGTTSSYIYFYLDGVQTGSFHILNVSPYYTMPGKGTMEDRICKNFKCLLKNMEEILLNKLLK